MVLPQLEFEGVAAGVVQLPLFLQISISVGNYGCYLLTSGLDTGIPKHMYVIRRGN